MCSVTVPELTYRPPSARLLDQLVSRGSERLGQVAREVRLGGGERREPVDWAGVAGLLFELGDALEHLRVGAKRRFTCLFRRRDDPLVELPDVAGDLREVARSYFGSLPWLVPFLRWLIGETHSGFAFRSGGRPPSLHQL